MTLCITEAINPGTATWFVLVWHSSSYRQLYTVKLPLVLKKTCENTGNFPSLVKKLIGQSVSKTSYCSTHHCSGGRRKKLSCTSARTKWWESNQWLKNSKNDYLYISLSCWNSFLHLSIDLYLSTIMGVHPIWLHRSMCWWHWSQQNMRHEKFTIFKTFFELFFFNNGESYWPVTANKL